MLGRSKFMFYELLFESWSNNRLGRTKFESHYSCYGEMIRTFRNLWKGLQKQRKTCEFCVKLRTQTKIWYIQCGYFNLQKVRYKHSLKNVVMRLYLGGHSLTVIKSIVRCDLVESSVCYGVIIKIWRNKCGSRLLNFALVSNFWSLLWAVCSCLSRKRWIAIFHGNIVFVWAGNMRIKPMIYAYSVMYSGIWKCDIPQPSQFMQCFSSWLSCCPAFTPETEELLYWKAIFRFQTMRVGRQWTSTSVWK